MAAGKVKKTWPGYKWPHRDIGPYGPLPNPKVPTAKKQKLKGKFGKPFTA